MTNPNHRPSIPPPAPSLEKLESLFARLDPHGEGIGYRVLNYHLRASADAFASLLADHPNRFRIETVTTKGRPLRIVFRKQL